MTVKTEKHDTMEEMLERMLEIAGEQDARMVTIKMVMDDDMHIHCASGYVENSKGEVVPPKDGSDGVKAMYGFLQSACTLGLVDLVAAGVTSNLILEGKAEIGADGEIHLTDNKPTSEKKKPHLTVVH